MLAITRVALSPYESVIATGTRSNPLHLHYHVNYFLLHCLLHFLEIPVCNMHAPVLQQDQPVNLMMLDCFACPFRRFHPFLICPSGYRT